MKYMGSKNRIAKYILPIILKNKKREQWYVEPFVGGANTIDKVLGKRMANDINFYLIALLKKLSSGWLPPKELPEQLYKDIKENKDNYPPELVGYAGFQLSYMAIWFSGYSRDSIGHRNFPLEGFNNVRKQQPGLKGILFTCKNYWEMRIPNNSLIYCDPPYTGTAKYTQNSVKFNHDLFWDWCRNMAGIGHTVFISEYKAPKDFECVWERELNNNLNNKKATERLFRL